MNLFSSLVSGIVNYFGLFRNLQIFYLYEICAYKSNEIYRFLHFAELYGINSFLSTPPKAAAFTGIAPFAPASLS